MNKKFHITFIHLKSNEKLGENNFLFLNFSHLICLVKIFSSQTRDVNVNRSLCELLPSWKTLSLFCVSVCCKWISFPHFAVTFLHAILPRRMHENHRHCKVSMKHEDEKGKTRQQRGNNKKARRIFRYTFNICDHRHSSQWLFSCVIVIGNDFLSVLRWSLSKKD